MENKMEELARAVLKISRNSLAIHLRFMDMAISRLTWLSIPQLIEEMPELSLLKDVPLATEGTAILYNPLALCQMYADNKSEPTRAYLHLLMHGVFRHFEVSTSVVHALWDLACDMAVEGVINDLQLSMLTTARAEAQTRELQRIAPKVNHLLTAEKIYVYLRSNPPSEMELARLRHLFSPDNHSIWYVRLLRLSICGMGSTAQQNQGNGQQGTAQTNANPGDGDANSLSLSGIRLDNLMQDISKDWQRIAERMQTDLETFHKQRGDTAGSMMQNLRSVNREKYDYAAFLRKFAVLGEAMKINEDEFDYVFYTYGMKLFPERRMPLIEPLEYKDVKRIREFVIAIDTSGSVAGELVQKFLQKTYNILKQQESFFSRINLHIIQCDADIQEDDKITSQDVFDAYLQTMQIRGLGGTDFRPVFSYVEQLRKNHEFTNLKGLIYFTDGYGVFPEKMPDYPTAFVFVDDDDRTPEIPVWAIKLVLHTEEI
ncbi:MAG: VWA-like domain-containing protein [Aristaeellaceae bacterium]